MAKFVRALGGGFANVDTARRIVPTSEDPKVWRVVHARGCEVLVEEAALVEAGLLPPPEAAKVGAP
jgi:hypothetical protein